MREPNCTKIVPTKNLWELAIEFIDRIDKNLMDFNLIFSYVTYNVCRLEKMPKKVINKLVFLSCFYDVGKLYAGEHKSNSLIETYLFLKYFSPVKNFAEVLIYKTKDKFSPTYRFGMTLEMCRKYTKYLLETNDKDQALKRITDEKGYTLLDIMSLNKLVNKIDMFYEINSMHYMTIVYKYSAKSMFNHKEKDKFFIMLSSLFEMYSAQTLYHSKLTAIISYIIAKKMKLNTNRCKQIYVAGLCHDLGKVCIPLKILEKPDKLTDTEYSKMKKHVEYTKEIMRNKVDYVITEIAYRHHEKLDGSGYPNKYTEKELTLDQRILEVSDIISALIAKRSYKEAWSVDKTIGILNDMVSKNQMDKDVVKCFVDNKDKILKLTMKFTNQADKIYSKINKEREELSSKLIIKQ